MHLDAKIRLDEHGRMPYRYWTGCLHDEHRRGMRTKCDCFNMGIGQRLLTVELKLDG